MLRLRVQTQCTERPKNEAHTERRASDSRLALCFQFAISSESPSRTVAIIAAAAAVERCHCECKYSPRADRKPGMPKCSSYETARHTFLFALFCVRSLLCLTRSARDCFRCLLCLIFAQGIVFRWPAARLFILFSLSVSLFPVFQSVGAHDTLHIRSVDG